ncbi:MAG TPA: hypothetical protein VMI56_13140 [Reyranella sp.]|nr:hypothetical protein [Reyranella sp.]
MTSTLRFLAQAACCLLLATTTASLAQSGGKNNADDTSPPPAAASSQWLEYRPAGRGFRIELPGVPTEQDATVQTGIGPVINHVAAVGGESWAFTLQYADFPSAMSSQPTSTTLRNTRNGELREATLRSEMDLTVSGLPAKRLAFVKNDNSFVVHSLIVVKGLRVYQAIHTVRPGMEKPADIDHFIRSFAILN